MIPLRFIDTTSEVLLLRQKSRTLKLLNLTHLGTRQDDLILMLNCPKEDVVNELEILEKIKAVVADKLDTDPADITESASFVDDLGADSLDVVELIMGLEDEFGIEISDEEAENLRTVGDAVKFVSSQA